MRVIILGMVCLGLMVFVWYDYSSSPGENTAGKGGAGRLGGSGNPFEVSMKNPYEKLRIRKLKQTRARPLFAQNRRPPSIINKTTYVPKFTRGPQKEPPKYILMGILSSGMGSVALLRDEDSGQYFRVEQGDVIGNIRVTKVLTGSVTMERDDGTSFDLKLKSRR